MPIASAICGDRLVELALVSQRIAEVGVGFGKVGLDADRLTICGGRLVEPALVLQRIAEIGKIKWILSILSYRLTDQCDSCVVAPHLMRNDAEQVEGIRMLGLGRQHAPITSLGHGQSSGLVVFDTLPLRTRQHPSKPWRRLFPQADCSASPQAWRRRGVVCGS